jgi:hypothetical protein
LRTFPGAVNSTTFETDSSDWVHYTYSSGKGIFNMRGKAAGGSFGIGTLKIRELIKFMLIDSTQTYHQTFQPTGNAITISAHFRGLPAIMGVGLRLNSQDDGIANPLAQLPGNGRYIVSFPKYGDHTGYVIINPTDLELSDFIQFHVSKYGALLPDGYNSWDDKNVHGTFAINGTALEEPTQVDSGTSDILLYTGTDTVEHIAAAGTIASIQLNDTTKSQGQIVFPFTTGRVVGQNRVFIEPANGKKSYIFGDPLFFAYDIYFDQVNGIIGLKKKQ